MKNPRTKSEIKSTVKKELYSSLVSTASTLAEFSENDYELEQTILQLSRCIRVLGYPEFTNYNRYTKSFE